MYKLDADLTACLQAQWEGTHSALSTGHTTVENRSHNSGEQGEGVCLDENEHQEENSRECTIHRPRENGYTKQLRLCRGRGGGGARTHGMPI